MPSRYRKDFIKVSGIPPRLEPSLRRILFASGGASTSITGQRVAFQRRSDSERCSPEFNKAGGRGRAARLPNRPGHSGGRSRIQEGTMQAASCHLAEPPSGASIARSGSLHRIEACRCRGSGFQPPRS